MPEVLANTPLQEFLAELGGEYHVVAGVVDCMSPVPRLQSVFYIATRR